MAFLHQGVIQDNRSIKRNIYQIDFFAPDLARQCRPGQFLHVRVSPNFAPLLRRPLSIYDVNREEGKMSLLYKVVGTGTDLLSRFLPGEILDVMGPLGRGFNMPAEKEGILLLGGGIGIAPLIYLARNLQEGNYGFKMIYAAASEEQLAARNIIEQLQIDCSYATDDGSAGFQGTAMALLRSSFSPQEIKHMFVCGPEPMMDAVIDYAREYGIKGEISLEEHMACGVGACLGCARKLRAQDELYVKVCKDGPVFLLQDMESGTGPRP